MIDRRQLMISTAALALAGCAPKTSEPLAALLHTLGEEVLDLSPELATNFGLDKDKRAGQKAQLDDRSLAARAAYKTLRADQLKRLSSIKRDTLEGMDAVNYDIIAYDLTLKAEGDRKFDYGAGLSSPYVLSQLSGAYQAMPDFLDSQHAIATAADAEAYISRLSGLAKVFDSEIETVQADAALQVLPPDFAIDRALGQMMDLRRNPASKATLVQSVVRRTGEKAIPGDWEARATKIYEGEILPALDRQIALLKDLRKKALPAAGAWKLPDGEDYYRLSLESQTSTKMTPAQVHQTGLDLVAEYGSRMDKLFRAQGMTKGTVGERLRAIATDPQYTYPNNDDGKTKLIADLNQKVREIQARLPQYFGVLPKAAVDIKRVPREIEAGAPGGYYQNATLDGSRPGAYYINLRDTAEVPSWTLPTLTYHEAVPGHHLQISIQQEQPLPFIRQTLGFNAYVEGWALYSEQLADEMGLYANDPFGQIGYLHDAMLRAVRLVVDSGIHDLRWSREQALKLFMDNRGDTKAYALTEIERYCVWPGQACGYMVGKVNWLKNRDRAKELLGAKFDIKSFHDAGLTPGAMPLATLDRVIGDYIEKNRRV